MVSFEGLVTIFIILTCRIFIFNILKDEWETMNVNDKITYVIAVLEVICASIYSIGLCTGK